MTEETNRRMVLFNFFWEKKNYQTLSSFNKPNIEQKSQFSSALAAATSEIRQKMKNRAIKQIGIKVSLVRSSMIIMEYGWKSVPKSTASSIRFLSSVLHLNIWFQFFLHFFAS